MLPDDSGYTLHLHLLGPGRLVRMDEPVATLRRSKSQALLFYLAMTGRPQRRSVLAALLWPEATDRQAATSLRTVLSDLRKLVGEHLSATDQAVSLQRDAFWLDVAQFEALLKRTGDDEKDALQLQAAVSLYAGDFLAGFNVAGAPDFEDWVLVERERLRQRMLNALLALAAWYTQQGDLAASLDQLTRLLSMEPASEAGHRQKMAVLARMGQRSTALQQYETCRGILAAELGVDPSPETMALYELIVSGAFGAEPAAAVEVARATTTSSLPQSQPALLPQSARLEQPRIDWRDAPDHTAFYGRQKDLAQLKRWLIVDGAGLVAIAGMGGVGKTTLAVELVERLAPGAYERVVWRSLVNAPPLDAVLDAWLQALAGHRLDRLPDSLDEKLAVLFAELQRQRCLLVLDNLESIMQSSAGTGQFHRGYEDYGQLIDRMGRSRHRSCLLLTTRDLPQGMRRMEEDHPRVRIMALAGLPDMPGKELLRHRGVTAPDALLHALVERYSGNPLALQLVADTVRDLFGSNVDAFLGGETPVFDDIRTVLDEQFGRLGDLERDTVVWLAIERVPTTAQVLWEDLVRPPARRDFLELLRSLQRNSLVETAVGDGAGDVPQLALQNVVMEYVTDRLVQTMCQELESGQLAWFHRHALVKAHSQEYAQESQRRLLLEPVATRLVERRGLVGAVDRLRNLLACLRQEAARMPGYAGANIIHLLLHLQTEVRGFDFSQLTIRQADLRTASLVDLDFRGAELAGSTFADTFGAIRTVAVSPNGQYLATGGSDGQVFVWQMATYRPHLVLAGGTQSISCVAWSPDSGLLASGSYDGQVRIWDSQAGDLVDTLLGHTDTVAAVAWSPDGAYLASAGADRAIIVWDVPRAEIYRRLEDRAWTNGLAFHPAGRVLASANNAGEVLLWDWRTGGLLQTLIGHEDKVHAVAFSPDGASLATGGEDGRICLWNPADPRKNRVLHGHAGWVLSVAFSPDGTRLVSGGIDRTIRIWDATSGLLERTLLGHANWTTAVAYSPDGATVVSGGYDRSIRLWDVKAGRLVHRLHGTLRRVDAVRFSPDGRLLASSGLDGPVRLWEVSSGCLLHALQGHRGSIRAVAFGRNNGLVAGGCDDYQGYVWHVDSGELKLVLRGHRDLVRSLAFSPDDRILVTGSYDRTVRVWLAATGQLLQTIPDASAITPFAMTFSPDGELFAHASATNSVNLVHPPSGTVRERLLVGQEAPLAVAHSGQDHLLACGTREGAIWVWEVPAVLAGGRGALRFRVQPASQAVWRLQFSPGGRWLAGYDEGGTVLIVDTASGQAVYSVAGVSGMHCLAFGKDGDTLITGDAAGRLAIRDASGGEASRLLKGYAGDLTSIDASSAEDLVASSSAEGAIRLWNLQTGECVSTLVTPGPYAGMNIAGATGITPAQRATLLALGAVEA